MTHFGQKLLLAVRPNTKLEQKVKTAMYTRYYETQEKFEAEMARRRVATTRVYN